MGFNMMKKGKSANKSGDSVTRNARSLGLSFKAKRTKERLEEIIAYGLDNIKLPSCTLLKTTTTKSSLGYTITRKPRIIWHAADQSVVDDPADAAYAEVHIEVTYTSPVANKQIRDTFSTIIQ